MELSEILSTINIICDKWNNVKEFNMNYDIESLFDLVSIEVKLLFSDRGVAFRMTSWIDILHLFHITNENPLLKNIFYSVLLIYLYDLNTFTSKESMIQQYLEYYLPLELSSDDINPNDEIFLLIEITISKYLETCIQGTYIPFDSISKYSMNQKGSHSSYNLLRFEGSIKSLYRFLTRNVESKDLSVLMIDLFPVIIQYLRTMIGYRDVLIKNIMLPMLKLSYESNCILNFVTLSWNVCLEIELESKDHTSISLILCILLSIEKLNSYSFLSNKDEFWRFSQYFLGSNDILLRRRGAFMLQFLNDKKKTYGSSEDICNDNSFERKSKKMIAKERKGNEIAAAKSRIKGNNHMLPVVEYVSPTIDYWWNAFLVVYQQIEGCNQDHLLSQVWEIIEKLFSIIYQTNCNLQGNFRNGIPLLNFNWLKLLLNIILNSTVPNIRKLCFYKILSRQVQINFQDNDALDWLFSIFLPLLASPQYFPHEFIVSDEDLNSINFDDTKYKVTSNPGILFPSYLNWILSSFQESESKLIFISKLIQLLCGDVIMENDNCQMDSSMSSFTSIRWMVRGFSDKMNYSEELIPKHCISNKEFIRICSLFDSSLQSCNITIKRQISLGLLPLLILGFNSNELRLYKLLKFIHRHIGYSMIIQDRLILSHIQNLISRTIDHSDLASNWNYWLDGDGDNNDNITYVAITCFLYHSNKFSNDTFSQLLIDIFDRCNKLYDHPYIPMEQQLQAIYFLHGCKIYSDSLDSHQRKSFNVYLLSHLHILDITSYLLSNLNMTISLLFNDLMNTIDNHRLIQTEECFFLFQQVLTYLLRIALEFDNICLIEETICRYLKSFAHFADSEDSCCVPNVKFIGKVYSLRVLSSILDGFSFVMKDKLVSQLANSEFFIIFNSLYPKFIHLVAIDKQVYIDTYERMKLMNTQTELLRELVFPPSLDLYSKYVTYLMELKWKCIQEITLFIASNDAFYQHGKELQILLDKEILLCNYKTLPNIFLTTRLYCQGLVLYKENTDTSISETISVLLHLSWKALTESSSTKILDVNSFYEFVQLCFNKEIMSFIEFDILSWFFESIWEVGYDRQHLLRYFILHLISIWSSYPSLSLPYFDFFERILTFDERKDSEKKDDEDEDRVTLCRLALLRFFELLFMKMKSKGDIIDGTSIVVFQNSLNSLITRLINRNFDENYQLPAMLHSEFYFKKLRLWQALTILLNGLCHFSEDEVIRLIDSYLIILAHTCGYSIRVQLEIFGGLLASKFPELILNKILEILSSFNHQQQTLVSYFIILGHIVQDNEATKEKRIAFDLTPMHSYEIIQVLMPWLSCATSMARTIAQFVVYKLIPRILSNQTFISEMSIPTFMSTQLSQVYSFLNNNKESKKMLERQQQFYDLYSLDNLSTVKGIIETKLSKAPTHAQDIEHEHLFNILCSFMKDLNLEDEMITNDTHISKGNSSMISSIFQTKYIPPDTLQLLGTQSSKRSLNSTRQSIKIVASLVEKITNIAGLSRTCEIFAAEELIISNMQILKSPEFINVAVSSDSWLHISEVKTADLASYMTKMKLKGYTIIAIEQTGASISLEAFTFPEKSILLLGEEKEGIPVELLQLVDFCVEIPQLGIIRSLNVHVSASIILWEYTRQRKLQ